MTTIQQSSKFKKLIANLFGAGGFLGLIVVSSSLHASDSVEYPESWGEIAKERIEGSQCPSIEGIYANQGEIYNLKQGIYSDWLHGTVILIPHNKAVSDYVSGEIGAYKEIFKISNQNEKKFEISTLVGKSQMVGHFIFRQETPDFICKDGWIELTTEIDTAGGEDSANKFITVRRLTRLADDSLIVHVKQDIEPIGLFSMFSESRSGNDVYQFKKLK